MRLGTDWSPGAREVGRPSRGSGATLPPPGFQSKTLAELEDIFTETAEAQELASGIGDAAEARQWLRTKLQAVGEKAGFPGALGEALGGETHFPCGPGSPPGEQPRSAWCFCFTSSFRDPGSLTPPGSSIPEGAVPICRVRVGLPRSPLGRPGGGGKEC